MACELPEESLFILNILYKNRNFAINRGYHSDKLSTLYSRKFKGNEFLKFKEAIKRLLNDGYITLIKKKEDKYYISDMKKAVFALTSHGYNTEKLL